jgi:predicted ATPase
VVTELPAGKVVFLFSDIEGSTRLLGQHPRAYAKALLRHDAIMRGSIEANDGVVFETVGDAVYAAFTSSIAAVRAALGAQLDLHAEDWPELGRLRVRMALHSGDVERRGDHYFGAPLYRCARLMAIGHGGQTLLSSVVADEVEGKVPGGATLRPMGTHRLKDLMEPERVSLLTHPDLPQDSPPLKSLDPIASNLPVQETSFIGRERERRELSLLLREHRLITLTGTGGSGKTRLGIQVAQEVIGSFDDGVRFVSLASVKVPSHVLSTIASALHVEALPGQPLLETVERQLASKETLLVLDNFEQVVGAAEIATSLVASCPRLRVLVTSRVPLRLTAEHLYPVSPLSQAQPEFDNTAPPGPRRSDAVTLFLDRALAVRPQLEVTDEVIADIADVCRQLEGLPLAIELAAARTRVLSPRAIRTRLGNRLALLTGGPRDAPDRHQSLRAAIAWSEELLPNPLRRVFARLGVFVGGWELDVAEAVCDADLDTLSALVDHSLVVEQLQPNGEPRFTMLETVRAYALESLAASDELEKVRLLHARAMLDLAERARSEIPGEHDLIWLDRLGRELDNVRAAFAAFAEAAEGESALRLAVAMVPFWHARGHEHEAQDRLRVALAAAPDVGPELRARAIRGEAAIARRTGEFERAIGLLQEAAQIYRRLGDRRAYANCVGGMAMFEAIRGNTADAMPLVQESLVINREIGEKGAILKDLRTVGVVLAEEGDFEKGLATFEESIALAREISDARGLLAGLCDFGQLAIAAGHDQRASAALEEALDIARNRETVQALAYISIYLGVLACRRGERSAGLELVRDGLASARKIGEPQYTADGLRAAAGSVSDDEPLVAARLWGAAEAIYARIGASEKIDRAIYAPAIERAGHLAGHDAFAAAWRHGRDAAPDEIAGQADELLRRGTDCRR